MYDTMCSYTQLGSRLDISIPKSYLTASYGEKISQKAKEVCTLVSDHKIFCHSTNHAPIKESMIVFISYALAVTAWKLWFTSKIIVTLLVKINHFAYFVKMWLLHWVAFVAEHRIGLTVSKLLSKCDQYTSLFWSHETFVICLNPNAYNFRPAVQNNDTLYM